MSETVKTLSELSHEAREVLYSNLGVANTMRFLGQFERGEGDYTAQRDEIQGSPSVAELGRRIRAHKSELAADK